MATGMAYSSTAYVSGSASNDEVKHRILNVYAKFVSDVEPDRLSDWLVQESVITIDQKQRIRLENTLASDRCRAILDHLFSIQHPRAFLVVRQALREDNHYLLETIDNQEPGPGIRVQPQEQSVLPEEGESKSKKTDKQVVLSEQSSKNDMLRKEVEDERRDKESLRSANEQLRIDMNKEMQANKTHKMTIKTLKDSVEKLEQELIRVKQDQFRYISDPAIVLTIKTKAAKEEQKVIRGLTILDKELFVADEKSSEIEVYNSITLSFSRRWNLKELIDPVDLVSCNRNKCLYIMDYKGDDQSKEILRVDSKGKLIKNWSIGDSRGRLSVTDESNVILLDCDTSKLYEYSPDGQLIHEINLSSRAGIRYLRHAIKLTNDHFAVSHGYFDAGGGDVDNDDDDADDDRQRVCIVDADGKLKKSFQGERGSTIAQLNDPISLAIDGNGFIMVADQSNSRVLLLDSDLEFKREILSKEKHGLRRPSKIRLDESNGRLFVADNDWNSEKLTFFDGRILIFDF